jgi:hypothetical protein
MTPLPGPVCRARHKSQSRVSAVSPGCWCALREQLPPLSHVTSTNLQDHEFADIVNDGDDGDVCEETTNSISLRKQQHNCGNMQRIERFRTKF